jgi:hypothetical protein
MVAFIAGSCWCPTSFLPLGAIVLMPSKSGRFAAITLCTASQRIFTVVWVLIIILEFPMVNLKDQYIFTKFCIKIRKIHQKRMKCSKKLLVMSWFEWKTFGCFFSSNIGKLCLKIVNVHVIPPKAAHIKTSNEGSQNTTVETVGRSGFLYGTC